MVEPLFVEEVLDLQQHLHVLTLVDPVLGLILRGGDPELGLPEPENVRFSLQDPAYLADLEMKLVRIWGAVTPSLDASGLLGRFVDVDFSIWLGRNVSTRRAVISMSSPFADCALPRRLSRRVSCRSRRSDLVPLLEAGLHRFEDGLHDVLGFLLERPPIFS